MSRPVCPKCDSPNVVPSLAKNSHNNCIGCGYTGFVREFHPEHQAQSKLSPFVEAGPAPGEPVEEPRKPRYWWQED